MDKTVQRVGREIGGARKQRVLQTGQLETRICTLSVQPERTEVQSDIEGLGLYSYLFSWWG
jgi:hypothetical protein